MKVCSKAPSKPENHRKPWSSEELRAILACSPTRGNVVLFAAAFRRTEEAVQLVYRWAMTPMEIVKRQSEEKMGPFPMRVKRIAKELGWVA